MRYNLCLQANLLTTIANENDSSDEELQWEDEDETQEAAEGPSTSEERPPPIPKYREFEDEFDTSDEEVFFFKL